MTLTLQSPRVMTFYDLLDDEEDEEEEDGEEEEVGDVAEDGSSDDDGDGNGVLDKSSGAHGMSLDASDVQPSRYKPKI
jgi:hypothetical protein